MKECIMNDFACSTASACNNDSMDEWVGYWVDGEIVEKGITEWENG